MGVFSPVGSSPPSAVTISAKSTPVIRSVTLNAVAGVETLVSFSSAVVAFKIKAADGISKVSIATTSGNTATDDKFDLYHGEAWEEEFLTTSAAKDFYISSNKTSTVLQIFEWT